MLGSDPSDTQLFPELAVDAGRHSATEPASLLDLVEVYRAEASRHLDVSRRSQLGQFFTPAPTAKLMAEMFRPCDCAVRLLDAGAGIGSLSAAFVASLCKRTVRPTRLSITAYEVDPVLASYLAMTLDACRVACEHEGIAFQSEVLQEDFIDAGVTMVRGGLFAPTRRSFECAIVNPPYRKINSNSRTRLLLRTIGVETSNLYTGFLAVVTRLLGPGGELVAITPRSFCNGPYFRPFREEILATMTFDRFHIFESREHVFRDDEVLQENVIFHAVKGIDKSAKVLITTSATAEDELATSREVEQDELVQPDDDNVFIHLVPDEWGNQIAKRMATFKTVLADLGLSVSTGRVVDFRAKRFLRAKPDSDTAPLIYPGHFHSGYILWPNETGRKPNALLVAAESRDLLVPSGTYVLVRRFSAKEEKRRVVAAICDPSSVPGSLVGFENHLNYFHSDGSGLPPDLAKGLAVYLNSTLVDSYFRQFNGHTQVNATDLRSLCFPTRDQLTRLGKLIGTSFPDQGDLDRLIEEELFPMSDHSNGFNPVRSKERIEEALAALRDLGLPPAQQNERSALTLLALLDVKPDTPWSEAHNPLRGITPMMDFFAEHYGKRYAPNTRETVRRQTVHQFLHAGLILINPDDPERPVNSPKAVYQIEPSALALLRTYGTGDWPNRLQEYLESVDTLTRRYAQDREMGRIPVTIEPGKTILLSPGGQNVLIEKIVHEFCPRFTPGGKLIYVGDTDKKFAYFDESALRALGVTIDLHGKMPDIVVYFTDKNWLVLIEAVTSHGPMDPTRRSELQVLFKGAEPGLVFVTAFLTRRAMVEFLQEISWETEVWVAEAPSHMIHFNGERFLGPY